MEEINWCIIPERYILSTVYRNKIGKWTYESYTAMDLRELQGVFSDFEEYYQKGHKEKDELPKRGVDYEFAIFTQDRNVEKYLKYEGN